MSPTRGSGAGRDAKLVDFFSFAQIGREYRLSSTALHLLIWLTGLADKFSGQYHGTLSRLHGDSRIAMSVLPRSLNDLVDKGLIEIMEPFAPGREGTAQVAFYADLTVLPPSRADLAHFSRGSNGPLAYPREDSGSDQHFRDASRYKAVREKGSRRESRVPVAANEDEFVPDVCSVCGGPADSPVTGPGGALLCVDCEDPF